MNLHKIKQLTSANIDPTVKVAVFLAHEVYNKNAKYNQYWSLDRYDVDQIVRYLSDSVRQVFDLSLNRLIEHHNEQVNLSIAAKKKQQTRQAFALLKGRKALRALLRKKLVAFKTILRFVEDALQSQNGATYGVEKALRRLEKHQLHMLFGDRGKYEGKAYHDLLPLYACSGELEAGSLHYYRAREERKYWHVGRDGGGQPEIRFRVNPMLTEKACKLVSRIGSQERNGGHIHLNCRKDTEIGTRVFAAFRTHLVWFRYLANASRRNGRWSNVSNTPNTFTEARRIKAAAVSCNTWQETGTVEVRLWGTTSKPSEWAFRTRLMQSMARMSETVDHSTPPPIQRNICVDAFMSFARWAAPNDPQTLRELLNAFRKKARGTRDRIGTQMAAEFVAAFDGSVIPLRGYRRRTITENTTTAGLTATA
jgi:hypothetical protein